MAHNRLPVVFEHGWWLQLKEHCKFKKWRQRKHTHTGSATDRDRPCTLDWSLQGFEAQRLINKKISAECMKFGKKGSMFCTKIFCARLVNFNANSSLSCQVKCKMGDQCPPSSIWGCPGLEGRSPHSCHLHNYIPQLICSAFHFSVLCYLLIALPALSSP